MREALLIFRKDVRHVWWELFLLSALMVGLAALDSPFGRSPRAAQMLTLLEFIISFVAWFVIVMAIQEEKLAGDRQYWLTRPIHQSSLLIAKLLFIALLIMLPTLAAQITALARAGLSPWPYRSDLLAFQATLAASAIVIAVVASIVKNVSEFVSVLLVGGAIGLAGAFGMGWVMSWLANRWARRATRGSFRLVATTLPTVDISSTTYFIVCLVGLAAAVILVLHYARRRTAAARIGLVVLALFEGAAMWSPETTHGLVSRFLPPPERPWPGGNPTLSFDPAREPPVKAGPSFSNQVHIPIRIEGLPPGMIVAAESIGYTIYSPGEFDYGQPMVPVRADPVSGNWSAVSNGGAWLRLNVERSHEHQAPAQHFHARLRLVLLDVRTAETPLSGTPTRVMKDAWCSTRGFEAFGVLTCFWPFESPDYIQVLNPPRLLPAGRNHFTPRTSNVFLAPSPCCQGVWQGTATIIPLVPATVEARKAIARFERTLDIPSISIWKYTTPGDRNFECLSQQQ